MVPVCAAIHDLSCYAKSSLTVVLPTLEVMGIETCPLPTALLSSQTDGFASYYFRETTGDLSGILEAWAALGLSFDAIYSGFLGSAEQAALVMDFIESQRRIARPLVLVDPVLGDEQSLYGPMDEHCVQAMKNLVKEADIITPNTTEAALLLDRPFKTLFSVEEISQWARDLASLSAANVVITSVPFGQTTAVVAFDGSEIRLLPYEPIHVSYPGCGDLFSSILLGLLIRTGHFFEAVANAVSYTSLAISRSVKAGLPMRHGVSPTLILPDLAALFPSIIQ